MPMDMVNLTSDIHQITGHIKTMQTFATDALTESGAWRLTAKWQSSRPDTGRGLTTIIDQNDQIKAQRLPMFLTLSTAGKNRSMSAGFNHTGSAAWLR